MVRILVLLIASSSLLRWSVFLLWIGTFDYWIVVISRSVMIKSTHFLFRALLLYRMYSIKYLFEVLLISSISLPSKQF